MLLDFLDRLISQIFDKNWRTTTATLVMMVSGFVAMFPDRFGDNSLIVQLSKYIALGGLAALGINAKDKQVSGSSKDGR